MTVTPYALTQAYYNLDNYIATTSLSPERAPLSLQVFIVSVTVLLENFLEDLKVERSLGQEQARMYAGLEGRLAEQYGLDGEACLLRFICELQQQPLARDTVAGHLLSILFTPAPGEGDAGELKQYLAAQGMGRGEGVACGTLYSSCPFSVFHYFDALGNLSSIAL